MESRGRAWDDPSRPAGYAAPWSGLVCRSAPRSSSRAPWRPRQGLIPGRTRTSSGSGSASQTRCTGTCASRRCSGSACSRSAPCSCAVAGRRLASSSCGARCSRRCVAQAIVGEVQYRNALPWGLVLVHVVLAATIWTLFVALRRRALATAGRAAGSSRHAACAAEPSFRLIREQPRQEPRPVRGRAPRPERVPRRALRRRAALRRVRRRAHVGRPRPPEERPPRARTRHPRRRAVRPPDLLAGSLHEIGGEEEPVGHELLLAKLSGDP